MGPAVSNWSVTAVVKQKFRDLSQKPRKSRCSVSLHQWASLSATNLGMMLPDRLPSSDLDFAICFLPFSICHSPKSGCIHFPHTERLQNHGDRHAAISGTSWRSFCTAQLVVLSIPSAIVGPMGRNEPVWGGQTGKRKRRGVKTDATLLLSFSSSPTAGIEFWQSFLPQTLA